MTFQVPTFTRRALLGAAVVSVALPRLGLGQEMLDLEAGHGETKVTIRIAFNGQSFTATLYDNPSANDFASMLPLDLTIGDYSNNEKIAYLPRKLTEDGAGPFTNEAPGDLCYYAPWGNLAFFFAGYRHSRGLIRLGRLDSGIEPLLVRGEFPLHVERIS